MKISSLINNGKLSVSFEIFPPKPGGDMEAMKQVVDEITQLGPDFISVTYGASGSTSKNTLGIADYVQSRGVTALAHLTCVSATHAEIEAHLDALQQKGVENILALRGDIPQEGYDPSKSEYRYAVELVEQIKARGQFCIGAACYPEGHVESGDRNKDIEFLKQKVDAGVDFLTTQMFFDNNELYRFLYRALKKGIDLPVLAGIMPVTNAKTIGRSVKLSGASLPPRFASILDRFGDQPKAMKQAGIAYATDQIIDLIANGVRGIHIYAMNKPDIVAAILHNLSDIIGAER